MGDQAVAEVVPDRAFNTRSVIEAYYGKYRALTTDWVYRFSTDLSQFMGIM